jgi:general secretion pathway protein G
MKKLHFKNRKKQAGVSMIEIMIGLAIIAIIASIAVPNLMSRLDQAKVSATKAEMASIVTALNMYKLDNGHYPSTSQGLKALVERPSGTPAANNWAQEGYLRKLPKDKWNNDFLYIAPGSNGPFDIISYGADGIDGGESYNADIYSSEL